MHQVRALVRPVLLLPLVAVAAAVIVVFSAGRDASPARAIAPCVAHSPAGEELTFLQALQSWRDSNIAGSYPLSQSSALNAAAAGYAQFLADTPGASGHYADGTPGYAWATRAVACGYPQGLAAGGEGLAVVEASVVVDVTAQQALATMAAHAGSGIWVPSDVGLPVKCVGVAKATSANGKKVAWVTLLFASSGSCPGGGGGGTVPPTVPGASVTVTSTSTATATLSPTPSATPTATPKPVYLSWFAQLAKD